MRDSFYTGTNFRLNDNWVIRDKRSEIRDQKSVIRNAIPNTDIASSSLRRRLVTEYLFLTTEFHGVIT
jgi:hypothetical protein